MKKGIIIGVLIVIILVSIFIFYNQGNLGTTCASAGEGSRNPSLGPDKAIKECCGSLVEIASTFGYSYDPTNEFADENGCVLKEGGGLICSDCSNGICEEWENPCTCSADCR
jgi:hypothetical protein